MQERHSRRSFVQSSLLASAAIPLALSDQTGAKRPAASDTSRPRPEPCPQGTIANQPFSRFMMGGNLIAGWAHSRDLPYVSTLMRRYNTPAKIRETLELGESLGITSINTWVMDDN